MGLFSSLAGSFKKSKKLQKLQKQISPPSQNVGDMVSDLKQSLSSGISRKDQAFEEFLDFCEVDEGVAKIMNQYNINRDDLKNGSSAISVGKKLIFTVGLRVGKGSQEGFG